MKEDILEQIVDDYLKFSGFFTAHDLLPIVEALELRVFPFCSAAA